MRGVFAAGAVAFFAADVPLGDLLCFYVVVDGVASVAGWSGGTLHVVGRGERLPPIRSLRHNVRPPNFMRDIPLRAFREVVVSDFFEITLLPDTAVNEGHIIFCEFSVCDCVR